MRVIIASPQCPLSFFGNLIHLLLLLLGRNVLSYKLHWRSNEIEVRSQIGQQPKAPILPLSTAQNDQPPQQLYACPPCHPNESKAAHRAALESAAGGGCKLDDCPLKRRRDLPNEAFKMHKHPIRFECSTGYGRKTKTLARVAGTKKRRGCCCCSPNCGCCNPCTSTCCCPCCNCHWPCCGCSCQCGCCKKCCCCCCKPCCCCCGGGGRRRRRRHLALRREGGGKEEDRVELERRHRRQMEFHAPGGGGDGHWNGDGEDERKRR